MKLYDDIRKARNVSVPLVAVETSDPAATIIALAESINGDGAKYRWDFIGGMRPMNEAAQDAMPEDAEDTVANPAGVLACVTALPPESVVFIENAHKFADDVGFIQGLLNARERLKVDHRMLILLGQSFDLPLELQGSVVMFDEPLPDAEAAHAIISDILEAAEMDGGIPEGAVAAVQGLPAFQVEQLTAMSLTREGLDVNRLWDAKRKQIEQTPGLRVFKDTMTFDDLGGLNAVKDHVRLVMDGPCQPNAVVWIDELEKALAGTNDMTGVTADQLGVLLQYMEDSEAAGFLFVGHPGTGKSAVAKSAGTDGGVPTIQFDLGAMMGSLVGQSQHAIRTAVKTVDAISGGKTLWIATCNNIDALPPELLSRFSLGTYFFDLPTDEERLPIWNIHQRAYDIGCEQGVNDEGWTGREIRNCCKNAHVMNVPLERAAKYVIPLAQSNPKRIDKLQEQAHHAWLDASHEGVYMRKITRESATRSLRV